MFARTNISVPEGLLCLSVLTFPISAAGNSTRVITYSCLQPMTARSCYLNTPPPRVSLLPGSGGTGCMSPLTSSFLTREKFHSPLWQLTAQRTCYCLPSLPCFIPPYSCQHLLHLPNKALAVRPLSLGLPLAEPNQSTYRRSYPEAAVEKGLELRFLTP